MRLLSLTLEHFRSYNTLNLSLPSEQSITVLRGDNATGKTSVLEAISVLALLKPPKKISDSDLIRWDATHYRITAQCVHDNGEEQELEVISQLIPKKSRVSRINGVNKSAQQYVGSLPLLTFSPDDLFLFRGTPADRRRILDSLLCQTSPSYLQALIEYDRVLKQRNTLLKQIRDGEASNSSLSPWDEKIASLGAIITQERIDLINSLNENLLPTLKHLGEKPDNACVRYIRKGEAIQEPQIYDELKSLLLERQELDCIRTTTSIGPHRDDWMLEMNKRNIASFASRGQQRAAILSLLLLQAKYLEQHKNEKPILLFDDVFSELDEYHREALMHSLIGNQVIITTIEADSAVLKDAQTIACPIN